MHRFCSALIALILLNLTSYAQRAGTGIVTGNILERETGKSIPGATVSLINLTNPSGGRSAATSGDGSFTFNDLAYGTYRLQVSAIGFNALSIDSIHIRQERSDFNLSDLKMAPKSADMDAVVVYAEKPLIQTKGGNLTFNAAESPLSAGASANELLRNVPLVATDANGNLIVEGKTPIVLIDSKPVNLNAQQLQDFLDALPGNMIEKIEVMTNPPAEYANESGSVINIVTRKGRVGIGGRLNVYGGTRGEYGANTNINYRDHHLALNFSIGDGYNKFQGNGHSERQNIFKDSTNFLNTTSRYTNTNTRPSSRLSVDYDLDKHNSLNAVFQANQNNFDNHSNTGYSSINHLGSPFGLSDRTTGSEGYNLNPNANLTFRHRGLQPEEQLEVTGSYNYSHNKSDLSFFQQYISSGTDSTQHTHNESRIKSYEIRTNYDKPLDAKANTILSLGGYYNYSGNDVKVTTSFLDKSTQNFVVNDPLSSDLFFLQTRTNLRLSVRQTIVHGLVFTGGTSVNRTQVDFDLYNTGKTTGNTYWNWLPFGNINKSWEDGWNATLIYRRTIRRPGLDQMNPSIDYSDPYNIRYGNPQLLPSLSHEFSFNAGKGNSKYYFNGSIGLNKVQNIFTQITTLQPNGTTQTTYDNISNRTEYNAGSWSGYTFSRALKVNIGLNYIFSQYGSYDKSVNKYQDNGSFYSNFNVNYIPAKLWNLSLSCLYNRNGNPQGVSTATVNTNLGIQRKFFQKKIIVTLNVSDPFIQQSNTSQLHGPNFDVQSYSTTQTRNYRLTLSYDWNHTVDRGRKQILKAAHYGG
ncbi:MAG: outer membrane beta-barrel protein [Bacteroidetes bacterium]|nr:outer membrane beta-barrel protein [Bacteroidota bacterium]